MSGLALALDLSLSHRGAAGAVATPDNAVVNRDGATVINRDGATVVADPAERT